MRTRCRSCLAVAMLALGAGANAASAQTDITAVAAAWSDRQDKVKSYHFEWTDHQTIPKGRTSRNRPGGGTGGAEIPPHDLIFASPRLLTVDGARSRFQFQSRFWSVAKNVVYTESSDTAFDGNEYKNSATYEPPVVPANGVVKRAKTHPDLGVLSARPITVALRGTDPLYKVYDVAAFEPTNRTVTVNGVRCVELVREPRPNAGRTVLLVDPARGFLLVRSTGYENARLIYQLDISYSSDSLIEWVPMKWEYTAYDPEGRVHSAGRCTVAHYELNPSITDGELTSNAKPGTLMVDSTHSQSLKYVVQADGRDGQKVPRNSEVSYEQLAGMASVDGPRPWWRTLRGLFAAGVLSGAVGLLGWRVYSRTRREGLTPATA